MRRSILLALSILCATVPAWTTKKKAEVDVKRFQEKLSKDEQVLHVLDRLTFGPRPGDVEIVKKMGVKKWIDLQLHPEKIAENPALEAKLAPLETLRLTQGETEARYPSPQLVRAVSEGRQPLPEDPIARAAVERLARRFKVKKDGKDADPMEPAVQLETLLTQAQIKTLRNGAPDQKKQVLASIPQDQIDDVVIAMPQGLRGQLMPVASEELRRKLLLSNNPLQMVAHDLSDGKIYRAILSNRQLQEQLVDFWYNHFNVYLDKGNDRYLVPSYEREAIRPHVLGHFRDLLEATATAPAMLFYLDNWESVASNVARRGKGGKQTRGLNENYGRELLELHTLGVDGGYTQMDVTEVARCFTGWTIKNPQAGSVFNYNDRVHDKGEKIVLGVKIPAGGGKDDGEKVLDILARHPSTARFISRKLAQQFVADNPPQDLLDRMAKTFLDTNGDIRAVMNTMLTSKEFLSQGAYQSKVKTPFEMIVSSIRATGAQVDYASPLEDRLKRLGQPLYLKDAPTGYSSANAEWINSAALLERMNFALDLTQNKVQGTKVDQARFKEDPAHTARLMLFTNPSAPTRDAIEKAIADQKTKNPKASPSPALVAGLVIGSPDFQRR
ncbi:MAG: DUF1800 domain-containing protein [Bryobacteraceae bacterium]|jgi:uncharacterized protein (DUF1800 family)